MRAVACELCPNHPIEHDGGAVADRRLPPQHASAVNSEHLADHRFADVDRSLPATSRTHQCVCLPDAGGAPFEDRGGVLAVVQDREEIWLDSISSEIQRAECGIVADVDGDAWIVRDAIDYGRVEGAQHPLFIGTDIADRLWEIADIAKLVEDAETSPKARGTYKRL